MMKLTVTARQVVISDAARQHIEQKLGKLERVLNDSALSAQVILSRQREQFACEITLHARGDHMLVGVARHARLVTAVSAAVEKVAQQAKRLADRWKSRRKNGAQKSATALGGPAPAEAPASEGPRVIRSRRYAVKPMSVDDAVLALAGGEQTFLVFRIAPSDAVAVVYRRPDGHIGLIDTGV
jgi:putative sigma-54 modulation protein